MNRSLSLTDLRYMSSEFCVPLNCQNRSADTIGAQVVRLSGVCTLCAQTLLGVYSTLQQVKPVLTTSDTNCAHSWLFSHSFYSSVVFESAIDSQYQRFVFV